jgi:hypothetical protein
MSWKHFTTESIIGMLREAEIALAQGMKVGKICRLTIRWGQPVTCRTASLEDLMEVADIISIHTSL